MDSDSDRAAPVCEPGSAAAAPSTGNLQRFKLRRGPGRERSHVTSVRVRYSGCPGVDCPEVAAVPVRGLVTRMLSSQPREAVPAMGRCLPKAAIARSSRRRSVSRLTKPRATGLVRARPGVAPFCPAPVCPGPGSHWSSMLPPAALGARPAWPEPVPPPAGRANNSTGSRQHSRGALAVPQTAPGRGRGRGHYYPPAWWRAGGRVADKLLVRRRRPGTLAFMSHAGGPGHRPSRIRIAAPVLRSQDGASLAHAGPDAHGPHPGGSAGSGRSGDQPRPRRAAPRHPRRHLRRKHRRRNSSPHDLAAQVLCNGFALGARFGLGSLAKRSAMRESSPPL